MSEDSVNDVLRARDHYTALDLPVAETPLELLKRQYYRCALRVHPDKNKHLEAAAAFKRLSEAYEELGGGGSAQQAGAVQALYIAKLHGVSRKRARPFNSEVPPRSEPTSSSPATPKTSCYHHHASKSFSELLREYEAMGHAFNASNDEKHNEHRAKQISRAQRREKEEEAHTRRLQVVSVALETGADDRASSWRTFRKRAASVVDTGERSASLDREARAPTTTMTNEGSTAAATAHASSIAPPLLASNSAGSVACMLCRRMFPTLAALEKHRASSALHKSNLVLLEQEEHREGNKNEPTKENSCT